MGEFAHYREMLIFSRIRLFITTSVQDIPVKLICVSKMCIYLFFKHNYNKNIELVSYFIIITCYMLVYKKLK